MIWFCLASGPSMTQADADAVRGLGTVVAINSTARLAPWADILYGCDRKWWEHHSAEFKDFKGRRITIAPDGHVFGCEVLPRLGVRGLSRKGIYTGNNSGYQVINLAFMEGARTIVLLGYDMQHTGGKHHWHTDHPRPLTNFSKGMPELCIPKFNELAINLKARGVRLINCTRQTALTCFERMPLADALAELRLMPGNRPARA